jgi:hypothetical protein
VRFRGVPASSSKKNRLLAVMRAIPLRLGFFGGG